MMKLTNETFVKEIKIFWQKCRDHQRRSFFLDLKDYFGEERVKPIINKMQEKI